MAKCDLQVVLDEPNRVFEPGDRVTGRVVVDVDDGVTCNGLEVQHRWKTHGRGNTDWGKTDSQVVFEGEWEQAGSYEYEFEFVQPPGPQTYHGHYVNVDWYVYVTADIPWALDPDAEVDHLISYTGSRDAYQIGSEEAAEKAGQPQKGVSGCLGAFGVALAVAAGALLVSAPGSGDGEMLCGGLIMLPLGLWLAWTGVSRFLAKKKLGEIEVVLEPARVFPGETLTCRVVVNPPKTIELNDLNFKLTAAEIAVRGSGTNKRTYRQDLFEATTSTPWSSPQTLEGGVEHVFEETFEVPEDGPPSFDSGDDNKLQWLVETHVDIPSWPDWASQNTLIVVPGEAPETPDVEPAEPEQDDDANDWW